MMSAPLARTSSGRIAFTVAAVPTGMNAGVRISPRRMAMEPPRAAPSVAAIENEKRVIARGLAAPARERKLGGLLNHDALHVTHVHLEVQLVEVKRVGGPTKHSLDCPALADDAHIPRQPVETQRTPDVAPLLRFKARGLSQFPQRLGREEVDVPVATQTPLPLAEQLEHQAVVARRFEHEVPARLQHAEDSLQ